MTGAPRRRASWAVVKAPMAAYAACAREISLAMPVITVTDRTMDRVTAWVTRSSQKAFAADSVHHIPAATARTAAPRVASVSSRLRAWAAKAGGGGSTPASGSVTSARRASPGHRTRRRNRATKGKEGRRPWARRLPVGSCVASSWDPTPSNIPPARAMGRLDSEAKAAAAMAATIKRKKLSALTWGNSGARRTPASPANRPDSIQEYDSTRSASTPASSVMRGLSTTARMRRPIVVSRRNAVSRPTALSDTITPCLWR